MQEEYHAKGKTLYICFVDRKKALDRAPRDVIEWAMMKRGIPEDLVRSVMIPHVGAKTKVRVDFELSDELEVKVWMHQGCVLPPFFVVVVCHTTQP